MSKVLEGLLYLKSHEWVKVEGDYAYVGITDYAQNSLGSIVYLETEDLGTSLKQFAQFGTVESVKAASDIFLPLAGEIVEVNEEVVDNPEVINEDPYGSWLVKIKVENKAELANLLNAEQYKLESK